jgi:ribosome-associated toxin RatA of RatAB toxin-antitoxin module
VGQRVSETTHIAAPAGTVLDVITDLDRYPEWADGVLETEVLSRDDEGRPRTARFVVDAKVAEIVYTIRYAYTEHRVSWSLTEGETLSQLDGSYDLTPAEGGTEVRYDLEVDVDLPLPGFLKKRAAKQILEQGLRGLRRHAEAQV